MSKKSNKKSAKKKVLKKPGKKKATAKPKKKSGKKAPKKAAKKQGKLKKGSQKNKAKKPTPKKIVKKTKAKSLKKIAAKKPVKKTFVKKVAIKKPLKKIAKPAPVKKQDPKVSKPVAKPIVEKPLAQTPSSPAPAVKKAVKVVKPQVISLPKKSVVIDIKTGPEPAGRFELEYVVHASAQILFEFLTSPSGLSEWFCDDVNIRNGIYSFKWEENEQNARVVKLVDEKLVRFQWVDKHDNSYFEFRIERDDLTNDISLIIVDFAETADERASSALLWNSQVDKLLHVLGAYF